MHVLITGGAGYVGSSLVPLLLRAGHHVTVVDRFYFGESALAVPLREHGNRLRLVRADVRRVPASAFESIDALVDLAGISNDPACELDPGLTTSVNLDGAVRVARLARDGGASRIVFASSCSVYGQGVELSLGERAPLRPVSLYARCKAEAESRLLSFGKQSGISVTVLRFATIFGVSPRMRFDLAVNVMTKNAYVARRIVVDGGGRQWRPFVHVLDVAEAIARTLDAPIDLVGGETFNVGANENNVQILNLAYRVRDIVGGTDVAFADTDPDLRSYNVCFDKVRRVLDFKPRRSIEQGIVEIVEALREGRIDPDDRRWYTLKQYRFLADVERTWKAMAINGSVLS